MKFLIFPFLFCLHVYTGAQPCDASVVPDSNPTIAYKPRNNRCEGFYTSNVSRAAFELVSCTYGDFRFKSAQDELITIKLSDKLGSGNFNVQARGIPPTLYYRMDAVLGAGKALNWEVATSLWYDARSRIPSNIGLIAWLQNSGEKTYVPVICKSKFLGDAPAAGTIKLKFMSSRQLASLKWSVDGGPQQQLAAPLPLPNQPISLSLPENLPAGLHNLIITYRIKDSAESLNKIYKILL
jgi:hypothetical protein